MSEILMEVHCFSSDFGKKHPLILDRKYTRTELIHAPTYLSLCAFLDFKKPV